MCCWSENSILKTSFLTVLAIFWFFYTWFGFLHMMSSELAQNGIIIYIPVVLAQYYTRNNTTMIWRPVHIRTASSVGLIQAQRTLLTAYTFWLYHWLRYIARTTRQPPVPTILYMYTAYQFPLFQLQISKNLFIPTQGTSYKLSPLPLPPLWDN